MARPRARATSYEYNVIKRESSSTADTKDFTFASHLSERPRVRMTTRSRKSSLKLQANPLKKVRTYSVIYSVNELTLNLGIFFALAWIRKTAIPERAPRESGRDKAERDHTR